MRLIFNWIVILSDLTDVDLHNSCTEIYSNHTAIYRDKFTFNQFSSVCTIGFDFGFIFSPLENLISREEWSITKLEFGSNVSTKVI